MDAAGPFQRLFFLQDHILKVNMWYFFFSVLSTLLSVYLFNEDIRKIKNVENNIQNIKISLKTYMLKNYLS